MNAHTPIQVDRYMHTETQDGKGLIDAHFARATAHLMKFMRTSQRNRIRKIMTAKGLAAALAWGGGIQNSLVQLVSVERSKLDALQQYVKGTFNAAKKCCPRCNDIFFLERIGDWKDRIDLHNIDHLKTSNPTFRLRIQRFSSRGTGFAFEANLGEKLFRPVSDDYDSDLQADSGSECDDGDCESDEERLNDDYAYESETCDDGSNGIDDERVLGSDGEAIHSEEECESSNGMEIDESNAPEVFVAYGPVPAESTPKYITGVSVIKRSSFGCIKGPRDAKIDA